MTEARRDEARGAKGVPPTEGARDEEASPPLATQGCRVEVPSRGSWWQGLLLALGCTVFLMEGPMRLAWWWQDARHEATSLLSGVSDPSLRTALRHDFIDPDTKIKYAYDMFLGWRALPNQHGVTYSINSAGHRDDAEENLADTYVVILAGGSAAWSYGASSNAHTIATVLQEELRAAVRPDARVLNLAEQAYGLRQEESVVVDALTTYRPRLVVFLDGANDTSTVSQGQDPDHIRTYTEFPKMLKEALDNVSGPVFFLSIEDAKRLSLTMRTGALVWRLMESRLQSPQPKNITDGERRAIHEFFDKRILHLSELLTRCGVRTVFALQPTGYVDRTAHPAETFLEQDPNREWWRAAYSELRATYEHLQSDDRVNTLDLTHVMNEDPRHIYIDPVHMTDAGYAAMARALQPAVRSEIVR